MKKTEADRQRELEEAKIAAKREVVEQILDGWVDLDISYQPAFWTISGTYKGEFRVGVNADVYDLAKRMAASVKDQPPAPPPAPPPPVASAELMALLKDDEPLQDGKERLLDEYNLLTQRLLDDRYEMSIAETDRHEAISAILLELRA